MDKKTKGAWIIHHAQKILGSTNCTGFQKIEEVGSCGVVLGVLSTSKDSSISYDTARMLAASFGIQRLAFDTVVTLLKNHHLVDVSKDKTEIQLLGLTKESVLTHTAEMFDGETAKIEDKVAIAIAEVASKTPQIETKLLEKVSDKFRLIKSDAEEILSRSVNVGFLDSESAGGDRILFNGNLFRRDYSEKIFKVLSSLTSAESNSVMQLDTLLKETACIPSEDAIKILGESLFEKLMSIGMYDVSKISNSREIILYVSRPSAYSKFGSANDDPLDEAKALVASLSYGMGRSTAGRGKITYLSALMSKLIAGQEVGPATAIGEDYQVLERKRVISVRRDGNRFSMTLLKIDVGELALKALQFGDISTYSLPPLKGVGVTGFDGPETQRVALRKHVPQTKRESIETLKALRG